MKRGNLNYLINILMFISFITVAITGILKLKYIMHLIGLTQKSSIILLLTTIHDWSGVILVLIMFIHLILHWNWIIYMTKNIFKRR